MRASINGLLDVLVAECRLYKDLYDLSLKKSEFIVDGNVDGLTGILSVEQQLIIELGFLENQREQHIETWAIAKGIDPQRVTLSQITPLLDGNSKKNLDQIRKDLDEVISQQRQINDLNESLIKNNLDYIDFSIKLLAGQDESGTTYSKGGKTPAKLQNRNLFDRKA